MSHGEELHSKYYNEKINLRARWDSLLTPFLNMDWTYTHLNTLCPTFSLKRAFCSAASKNVKLITWNCIKYSNHNTPVLQKSRLRLYKIKHWAGEPSFWCACEQCLMLSTLLPNIDVKVAWISTGIAVRFTKISTSWALLLLVSLFVVGNSLARTRNEKNLHCFQIRGCSGLPFGRCWVPKRFLYWRSSLDVVEKKIPQPTVLGIWDDRGGASAFSHRYTVMGNVIPEPINTTWFFIDDWSLLWFNECFRMDILKGDMAELLSTEAGVLARW